MKKSVRKSAKKSVRKSAKKSVRKSAKKSVRKSTRKTKRSYRMDPPGGVSEHRELEMPELLVGRRADNPDRGFDSLVNAFSRRERDPHEVRQEKVKRLFQDAREGNATSVDDYKLLTPDEKKRLDSIYNIMSGKTCSGNACTPAEAFWQKDSIGNYIHPSKTLSVSRGGFNREAWKRRNTPAQIARAEDYVMKCMIPSCPGYGGFDNCGHTILKNPRH